MTKHVYLNFVRCVPGCVFVLPCVVEGACEQCHTSCKTCFAAFKENCSSCDSGKDLTF